ncbi:uncharacterized protein LOC126419531 [Schistocerca serialis cubense]|uniref:uncharacterized protein LOC126419531 n=1 Tax=Schistocerca serialis cubense TaxID=2023355 RepID=UPI00214F4CFA|nr:uncharacterized protein LOC126419531 [Schistocerca serialis cubense]
MSNGDAEILRILEESEDDFSDRWYDYGIEENYLRLTDSEYWVESENVTLAAAEPSELAGHSQAANGKRRKRPRLSDDFRSPLCRWYGRSLTYRSRDGLPPYRRGSLPSSDTEGRTRKQRSPKRRKKRLHTVSERDRSPPPEAAEAVRTDEAQEDPHDDTNDDNMTPAVAVPVPTLLARPGASEPMDSTVATAAETSSAPTSEVEHLVRGGFQPRLPTSLPPPGQQQQPSPLPRRQPVPLLPPAQLHPGAPQVVAPAPAVPLQSPPPSELMDVDPSAGPPSQAVAVQPVLQPLSLGTPKESDPAAPCPAPTQQPSTQRQETLPLFVGPDASSRPE